MSERKKVIEECVDALRAAKGRCREDCDGTTQDMVWEAYEAAKAYPEVAARFKAAVAKTDFAF